MLLVIECVRNMLFPFEKNYLHIKNFNGKHIFSAINDLFRIKPEISGYALCVKENISGLVLFRKGKVIKSFSYSIFKGGISVESNLQSIINSESLDFYINIISNNKVVKHIYQYFSSHYLFFTPFEAVEDSSKILNFILKNEKTGILTVFHGFVANMIYIEKGRFKYFLYYHPETKTFAYEESVSVFKSYFSSLKKLSPTFAFRDFSLGISEDFKVRTYYNKDNIVNMVLTYFDIFDIILTATKREFSKDIVADLFNMVFFRLRKKYSPLYKNLTFSKNSSSVNWSSILQDRQYITLDYRFENYHLYLDEIVKNFFNLLHKKLKPESFSLFKKEVYAYLSKIDRKDTEQHRVKIRIEQMIKNIK